MALYTHRNRWLLDLPMRMAQHDPVNTLSQNVGRAGTDLDAVFGAGAATPTKLDYRRGYSFDGGDFMECSAAYTLTTGVVSVLVTFDGVSGASDYLLNWETVGGDFVCGMYMTAMELRFYSGSQAAAANAARAVSANLAVANGQICTVVGLHDGTNTSIYVNGEFIVSAVTPLTPAATANPMWIGARTNGSAYYTGNIHHVGMADFALSPHQVSQYHNSMIRRVGKV